jgi:UDP-glucose 4-epimerase
LGVYLLYSYRGLRCVVTGGLGFIGSNLALRLSQLGAKLTVIDSLVAGCGANAANLRPAGGAIEIIRADIAETGRFEQALRRADVIFNLAGELSHLHSRDYPERDLALNTTAQLYFTRECARLNPGVRIVYASTRQVYGAPQFLPVNEQHPVQPVDFNGIHKSAACQYHLLLGRSGGLDPAILRLSNVYGPRMALDVTCQGFLSVYFRRALLGQSIEIYGDGTQIRDPAHVDDVVDAFLLTGSRPTLKHRIYNVGGTEPLSIGKIARTFAALSPASQVVSRPFPDSRKQIEIGSYYSDTSLIESDLGWRCTNRFRQGVKDTLDFYRAHKSEYLALIKGNRQCSWCEGHSERLEERLAIASGS